MAGTFLIASPAVSLRPKSCWTPGTSNQRNGFGIRYDQSLRSHDLDAESTENCDDVHIQARMRNADVTPRFDQSIVFPDIDAATLARESAMQDARDSGSAWQLYLRKVLPPVPAHRGLRVVQI
eukprot:gene12015-12104_t